MTIVWLVTAKRFLKEYYNHVHSQTNKYVNWMVQEDGSIRFYIEQTNGTNTYCYVHTGDEDTIPYELRELISEHGAIIGIEGIDIEDDNEIEMKLDDISSKIKYNQVNSK